MQDELLTGDATHIEEVVGQPGQVIDLPVDDIVPPVGIGFGDAGYSFERNDIANEGQRVTQFVREGGQELIFAPVGVAQRGVAFAQRVVES